LASPKFFSPFPKWLKSITDGAYAAMMNAIRHDETPNFYFRQCPAAAPTGFTSLRG
jgi:hypothetical protein